MTKFIFVTGGVMSGIGKGIVISSVGTLLQECGLKINIRKLDPYLNVDAGTMNPFEHGETFVTNDGTEVDMDAGHYFRFTGIIPDKNTIVSSGKIFQRIIEKERQGKFLGKTVQMIPHVADEIKEFIQKDSKDYDVILCEIGGNVGDIEAMIYLEAIRQLVGDLGRKNVLNIHLTYIPFLQVSEEFKTKPAQDSIKKLMQSGIHPDIVVCRYEKGDEKTDFTKKIALFSNLKEKYVILSPNVDNIYKIPYLYYKQGVHKRVMKKLKLKCEEKKENRWEKVNDTLDNLGKELTVNLIVKYGYKDAYVSLIESLKHAAYSIERKIKMNWIDARNVSEKELLEKLKKIKGGILVPGGFGDCGVENKMVAIKFARENDVPFLGICYGMQLAAIEFARNVLGIKNANTTERDNTKKSVPIVHIINEKETKLGGTMRLGEYKGELKAGSLAEKVYGKKTFAEVHRHRYDVNTDYQKDFEKNGMIFSGSSDKGRYLEILELPSHKFFLGVQFHPELRSTFFKPNECIKAFIEAVSKHEK